MPNNPTTYKARTLKAILLVTLGYWGYSVADLCSKALQEHYSIYQVLCVSGLSGLLITGLWLWVKYGASSFLPSNLKLHLIRALVVTGTAYFMVRALKTLPMADFYGIIFIMPFLVMIMAIFILGEKIGWRRWLAAAVGFMGVLIVAGPQFTHIGEGIICAFMGALLSALNVILLRKIGPGSPRPLYGFYPFVLITALNFIAMMHTDSFLPFEVQYAPYFILHGPVIVLAVITMSMGFSAAPETAVVAPFNYTQIIWGVLFGYVFFDNLPTATTWLGVSIIIGAGLYSIWREYRHNHHLS